MTKKHLILFTTSYPFGNGEQFLDTEIQFLSESFELITIIPMQIEGEKRETPLNVKINTNLLKKDQRLLSGIVSAILSSLFWKEVISTPLKNFSSIRKLMADISYAKRVYVYFNHQFTLQQNYYNIILYSYWMNAATVGIALLKNSFSEITTISRVHGGDLYKERYKNNYLPLRPFLLGTLDKVFTISDHGKQYIIDNYDFPNKVIVARLGTKDTLGTYIPSSNVNEFNIVSCSFLLPIKRLDLLANALVVLGKNNPNINIIWNHIGDGSQKEEILGITRRFQDNTKMIFHGTLENKEIINFYKINANDLFVNVSSSEGIPVSIMEAYSFGIPALATNVGGTSEIVNTKNGFLIDKHTSTEDLCCLLEQIMNNKCTLLTKSKYAKETWNKYYNASENYISFSKILLEL